MRRHSEPIPRANLSQLDYDQIRLLRERLYSRSRRDGIPGDTPLTIDALIGYLENLPDEHPAPDGYRP